MTNYACQDQRLAAGRELRRSRRQVDGSGPSPANRPPADARPRPRRPAGSRDGQDGRHGRRRAEAGGRPIGMGFERGSARRWAERLGEDRDRSTRRSIDDGELGDRDADRKDAEGKTSLRRLREATRARRARSTRTPRCPASSSPRRPTGTPRVVTGKDGKATVKFKAPMALSEYRFSARGVTGADTLVGQASASLVVRKDFFVDLKVPATLTPGGQAPVLGARSITSASRGRSRSGWRSTRASGSRSTRRRST